MTASPSQPGRAHPLVFVLAGGVIAGTLDIVFACVYWAVVADTPASRIFQSVAAGLLGPASFEGGAATAALGFLLQYVIATSMAVAYYVVARLWTPLRRQAVLCGAAYGLALYGIMNYVVVPLSAARSGSGDALWVGLSVAVHVVGVGVPIALCVRRAIPE